MSNPTFNEQLSRLTQGLLYISESEHPIDILDWPEVKDAAALKKQIAAYAGTDNWQEQSLQSFFDSIQQQADPNDPAMQEIAARFHSLRQFLEEHLKGTAVTRTGATQVHIFITGFLPDNAVAVLHTVSIET